MTAPIDPRSDQEREQRKPRQERKSQPVARLDYYEIIGGKVVLVVRGEK